MFIEELLNSNIISFMLLAALMVMSPGPNGVLIAKTVPTSGRAAGFANVAGFFASFYVHGTFAIFGISVLLTQSATAFMIVKYLGAAYLCWIGVKAIYSAIKGEGTVENITPAKRKRTLMKAFMEGFLTNALNPKVSLFYLSAFPQFIDVGQTSMALAYGFVTSQAILNAIWFSSMAILVAKLSNVARSDQFKQSFKRWLNGVTGLVFIGFGVGLARFKP
jgi:threonine/homoserine/homoserine lactone efflux protein